MSTADSVSARGDAFGARASNAGDSFHELWALRAALELLTSGTDLKAVTLEGVASTEVNGPRWDGVDCALFFETDTLETARRVEVAQLKYSTTDPDKRWTVARLTASSAKQGDNSVIRKLATAYKDARRRMASGATLAVRFVSNQPVSSDVQDSIDAVRRGEETEAAIKIRTAAGLVSGELNAFLEVLDFSETGSGSRLALKEQVVAAVCRIIETDSGSEVRELQQQVRDLMLPGRQREKVTLGRLLSWFGLSGLNGLFPVPPDLKRVSNPIPREPAQNLLRAIANGDRLVCIHGSAGCGKTTTLMQLPTLLPEGSVVVLFDCYGAGRYNHSNDRRHLPENAFLQIANELALKQGTPFLIANSRRNPATIRNFLERVDRAAKILGDVSPTGLLTMLIDAADNSVAAAEGATPRDPCFVWELSNADLTRLPANVRFVISSRTARKLALRLPNSTREIPCPAFTRAETAAFVRTAFPQASETWIDQFHALSSGIPRVQDYALRKGAASQEATLNSLRPKGKELDTVLRELFAEASNKAVSTNFYERCLAALAVLPAPVPVPHLAALCSASRESVVDFVQDVQPALRLEHDTVTISDEDVEDFIKSESASRIAIVCDDICTYFADLYGSDTYAAVHYGDMLAKAGRAAEILAIIENDLLPAAISDPIVRREVQLRRLLLALSACRSAGNGPNILKVVLLSAEAAKDEATLRDLLEKETDLSVRFARPSLVRLVLTDKDTYSKQGSILAQDAARAAEASDFFTAREQLYAYEHWLQRRREASEKKERKHGEWGISVDDLVARSETIAIVAGPEACREDLRRWRPQIVQLQVAMRLVPLLIARGHGELVRKAYELELVPAAWSLVVFVPLVLAHLLSPREHLAKHLSDLSEKTTPDLRGFYSLGGEQSELTYLETIVTTCEIGFAIGIEKDVLQTALRLLLRHRNSPSRMLTYTEAAAVDIALRAWLLLCRLSQQKEDLASFDKFLREDNAPPPPKRRGRKKKNAAQRAVSRTDDDLGRTVGSIFSVYVSRLDLLADAAANGGAVKGDPAKILKEFGHDAYYLEQRHWGGEFGRRTAQSVVRLMHLKGVTPEQLYHHAELLTKGPSADAYANRSYVVWQELLMRKSSHSLLADVVAKHAKEARFVRTGAEDKTNAFIKFSRLVLNFSQDDASALFERAIEIAQEVDREALNQIEFVAALSSNLGAHPPDRWKSTAAAFASFVTDVAIRLEGEEHFPWKEAVVALSNLAPAVSLAAIGQWQDEGVAGFRTTVPNWLKDAVEQRGQPAELICALQIILQNPSAEVFRTLATAAVKRLPKSAAVLEMLASDCLLYIPPGKREQFAAIILGALPTTYEGGEAMACLRASAALHPPAKSTSSVKPEKKLNLEIPADFVLTTAQGIKDTIAWAREQQGYIPAETVLFQALEALTSPADRIPFLNAISDFDGDSLDANGRAGTILTALDRWKDAPAVARWRETELPRVISNNLWPLSRWLKEGECQLVAFLDAIGLDDATRIDVIAQGLEAGAEHYGSKTLFAISEILACALPRADAAAILEWYVSRLYGMVPTDIRGRFEPSDIPTAVNHAVSRFLMGQLSDIDLRVRWRAAHALRRLVSFFGFEPLLSLFEHYDNLADRSYRLSSAPYYWLAARLWSVMTAARIAQENPNACVALAPKLLAIVVDPDLPHFLICQYAKTALETLLQAAAIDLPEEIRKRIGVVNVPVLPSLDAGHSYTRQLERRDRKERRFKFDSMDTIPYWYSPLFQLFAKLKVDAFYARLEEWLLDKWKIDPEANWWDKEPRRGRYDDPDFGISSHSHGSRPTVERYGTYVEWHAMFCALGEWLKTEPLAVGEDESDSLEYWAGRWQLTEPPTWLADRRGFTPLDRNLECDLDGHDKHWLRRIPRRKFLEAVVSEARAKSDYLVVHGAWTSAQLTRESRTSVHSALVDPRTAAALIRTVDDAKPYQTYLPYEEDRENDVDIPPFELRSWLQHLSHEPRFDGDDPLRHDLGGLVVRPGERVWGAFGLQEGPAPVAEWRSKWGTVSFAYESWADFGDAERQRHDTHRRVGSHGMRLRVDRTALHHFLVDENLDLIVKVRIQRRLENEYGRSRDWHKDDKEKTVEKALVFRQDGTIESQYGRVGAWTAVGKHL
jgi:hypothetical protein